MLPALIPAIAAVIDKVIDKVVPDAQLAQEIKQEALTTLHNEKMAELTAAKEVIIAEAQGESYVQRSWRPHLMYFLMFVIFFNAVIVPIVAAFGVTLPILDVYASIPDQLWTLLMIGMGGYITGRTIEKTVKSLKEEKPNQYTITPG